ncbi:uncharacterized protein EI97DRAFT_498738 [Westerdykella ornata]|uniref:Atos-like conserved domain-containing protein n=1 Tax=Westerdykella ornata TaxID=318751 RepID=A0A6A6JRH2_WESOR|nr:uncharacterized protein EI97DRAFT_498738 [Westerdykella ornata]KAF2279221.1 hypothetical protein EI97DRAFT_498738 [Westerdykella ornata]
MPVFHDHLDSSPKSPAAGDHASNESSPLNYSGRLYLQTTSRTEQDGAFDPTLLRHDGKPSALNRLELIERIKRANSPSWSQRHSSSRAPALHASREAIQTPAQISVPDVHPRQPTPSSKSPTPRSESRDRPMTLRRISTERRTSRPSSPDPFCHHEAAGIQIERPRSAFHSGDFNEKVVPKHNDGSVVASGPPLATSPVAPWHPSFPSSAAPAARNEFSQAPLGPYEGRQSLRTRAGSQSIPAFPFFLMPPTSPLVQQSNNTDLDFTSRPSSRQSSTSPERRSRRHTFSPKSFQTYQSRHLPGSESDQQWRRGGAMPYQAHQPRRSVTGFNAFQPHSSPQTPSMSPQRPSFSEASPLHHAPMVGSYEESILRGRMSTTPSRPLNFVARIGVLGKGQCKPSLRCPPHVTVPFPAVFYSYGGGNSRIADNSPSPYVGLIDLENTLPNPEDGQESKRKRRHTIPQPMADEVEQPGTDCQGPTLSNDGVRRREKHKRRSNSPRAPPGGSYRIPQQGQLQIIIQNPNKTAVKLFLVPYDLSDMEPGQKTFIRQRSYSAGPIIDMPLANRKNLGTDRPEAALTGSEDPNDRPILRYLIHLHICCPSKGRFYLYKSIRVVFANRVPDDKEKLRNEIQLPYPKYSTYKPQRDTLAANTASMASAQVIAESVIAEKARRRRSAGFPLSQQGSEQRSVFPPVALQQFSGATAHMTFAPISSLPPTRFILSGTGVLSLPGDAVSPTDMNSSSPFASYTESDRSRADTDSGSLPSTSGPLTSFSKRSVGSNVQGSHGPARAGESLLARKLRGLDSICRSAVIVLSANGSRANRTRRPLTATKAGAQTSRECSCPRDDFRHYPHFHRLPKAVRSDQPHNLLPSTTFTMRSSVLLSAFLATTASGLPAATAPDERTAVSAKATGINVPTNAHSIAAPVTAQDDRAATLYKQPNRPSGGQNRNHQDWIALPGNYPGRGFCIDMSNLFGNWDEATRSLSVEKGFRCAFYSEVGCSSSKSKGAMWVELGEKDKEVLVDGLGRMDRRIRSAECWRL